MGDPAQPCLVSSQFCGARAGFFTTCSRCSYCQHATTPNTDRASPLKTTSPAPALAANGRHAQQGQIQSCDKHACSPRSHQHALKGRPDTVNGSRPRVCHITAVYSQSDAAGTASPPFSVLHCCHCCPVPTAQPECCRRAADLLKSGPCSTPQNTAPAWCRRWLQHPQLPASLNTQPMLAAVCSGAAAFSQRRAPTCNDLVHGGQQVP